VGRIAICDEEKRGGNSVAVENGKSLIELAAKAIVEGQRNECWVVHRLHPDSSELK
jgi:hypothetical protein